MQAGSGYRFTVFPSTAPCPLCIWPGSSHVSLQPYCALPTAICPESHLKLSVNSLMTVRSPSCGLVAKPASLVQRHFKPNYTPFMASEGNRCSEHLFPGAVETAGQQRSVTLKNRKRRKRTIFTSEQLRRLESEFVDQQYIVGTERQQLAKALNLSETQIKIWFQNRRIKWRKENMQEYPDLLSPLLSCGLPGISVRVNQDEESDMDPINVE